MLLQVFEVDESAKAVQQVTDRVDTKGGFPVRLHGGALLGITYSSSITSGAHWTKNDSFQSCKLSTCKCGRDAF